MNAPISMPRGTVITAVLDATPPALVEATWLLLLSLALESALKMPVALPWPLFVAISLVNLAVARLPGVGDSATDRAVRVGIGLTSVALLTGWPLSVPRLLVAVLLVWRARALADITLPEERLRATVWAGTIGLTAALVLRSLSGITPASISIAETVAATGFIVLALWSLATAQAMELAAEHGAPLGVERAYLLPAAAILAILLGGTVLVALFPPVAALVGALLGLLARFMAFLFLPMIESLVYVLFMYLLEPIARYVGRRLGAGTRVVPFGDLIDQLQADRAIPSGAPPPFLHALLVGTVAALALLALVAVAVRLAARRRQSDDTWRVSTDRRTSLWTWTWLPGWLRRLRRKGSDILARVRDDAVGLARLRSVPMTAEGVYREVVRKAATNAYPPDAGIMPRQPQQTPFEYFRELGRSLPLAASDLLLLAGWYADVRYGGASSPASEKLRPVAERLFTALDDARRARPE